jgi:hypothetical protein
MPSPPPRSPRDVAPYSTPLRAACVEWLLPVPVTLGLFAIIGAMTAVIDEFFVLFLGITGAIICMPFSILAIVVFVWAKSRRLAEIIYFYGLLLSTALLAALGFADAGAGWGGDELYSGTALALCLFGSITPLVGNLFRRIALKRANALAAERAGRTGFHPTEVCAHCSHPLLSDASRCAECGSVSERS